MYLFTKLVKVQQFMTKVKKSKFALFIIINYDFSYLIIISN